MPPHSDPLEMLAKRFEERTLASFYMVCHPEKMFLRSWANTLLKTLPLKRDHPDVTYLTAQDEEDYKMEGELAQLLAFNNYPPLDLPWKFFFLEGPHLIPPPHAHKILKTLEESIPRGSIFFLHYSGQELLKTITSRAISLHLPPTGKKHREALPPPVLHFLTHGENLNEALEEIKKRDPSTMLRPLLDYHLEKDPDFFSCERLLKAVKHFQESLTYHNSFKERFSLLLHALADPPERPRV